jgi:UDP:flavonoid glycosyltransferase YjiC (YdhE family)
MRVLIAWEHGRNLGHLTRLLALAEEMRTQGAEVVWALPRHQPQALETVRRAGWEASWAPAAASRRATSSPQSFADILVGFGFADEELLAALVRAWLDRMRALRIHRVLLDYAPAAQLAACLAEIPAAQITNGFDAPPAHCPTFGLDLRGPFIEERNARTVGVVAKTIEAVSRRLAASSRANLQSVLEYPTRWFDCIPETDPYSSDDAPARKGIFIGPQGQPADAVDAEWPSRSGVRVLAYLRGRSMPRVVLKTLEEWGDTVVICAWPDARAHDIREFDGSRMRMVRGAISLRERLPEADLVINYGSAGFVCRTLLAGKPQAIFPMDAEKRLIATRIRRSVARLVELGDSIAAIKTVFDATLSLAGAAAGIAARYASVSWSQRAGDAMRRLVKDPCAGIEGTKRVEESGHFVDFLMPSSRLQSPDGSHSRCGAIGHNAMEV